MVKVFTDAKVSTWQTNGAVVIATSTIRWCGFSVLGTTSATSIVVYAGTSTAGTKIAQIAVPGLGVSTFVSFTPIVCTGGLVTTAIATLGGYSIFYK